MLSKALRNPKKNKKNHELKDKRNILEMKVKISSPTQQDDILRTKGNVQNELVNHGDHEFPNIFTNSQIILDFVLTTDPEEKKSLVTLFCLLY